MYTNIMNLILQCSYIDCDKRNQIDIYTKLRTCGYCKSAKYCDSDCQKKDWKSHKKFCAIILTKRKSFGVYLNSYKRLKELNEISNYIMRYKYIELPQKKGTSLIVINHDGRKGIIKRADDPASWEQMVPGHLQEQLDNMSSCMRCVMAIRGKEFNAVFYVFCCCAEEGVVCPKGTNIHTRSISLYYHQCQIF
jgi:hypothetical protein